MPLGSCRKQRVQHLPFSPCLTLLLPAVPQGMPASQKPASYMGFFNSVPPPIYAQHIFPPWSPRPSGGVSDCHFFFHLCYWGNEGEAGRPPEIPKEYLNKRALQWAWLTQRRIWSNKRALHHFKSLANKGAPRRDLSNKNSRWHC